MTGVTEVIALKNENTRLRDALELSQEKIAILEKQFGLPGPLDQRVPGFTIFESKLLGILNARDTVRYEALMVLLYGNRAAEHDVPDPTILKVVVSKMRTRLADHDIQIETIWGIGYRLTPPNKIKLQKLMAEAA